jgi:hypothetical protein
MVTFWDKIFFDVYRVVHDDNQFILYYYEEAPAKAALVSLFFSLSYFLFSFVKKR